MTPLDQVLMLDIEAKLDYETLGHIVESGHSRVPVYQEVEMPIPGSEVTHKVKKIIGMLLVKQCVLLDPKGTQSLLLSLPASPDHLHRCRASPEPSIEQSSFRPSKHAPSWYPGQVPGGSKSYGYC